MGLDMYVTIRHKDTQSKLDAYEAWENKYSYEEYELLTEEGMKFASEHLPSRSGFFFGNTDYNDNYVGDLENTIEQIDEAIDSLNCEYGFSLNSDLVTGEYNGDYIIEYTSSW